MNMTEQYDIVIVANGEFPTHPLPLEVLHNARHIIACDGAIKYVPQAEIVIGDGDSVPAEYHSRLIQVDEQEDNDLTKATRYCMKTFASSLTAHPSPLNIAYLGATGKREDHTLGNISLLMRYYRDMGIEGIILTDYGVFTPAFGKHTFESFKGQQVSILNFGSSQLSSEGLRWPSYAYEQWWQGTLNEAVGTSFTLHADGYYMVFQTYNAK